MSETLLQALTVAGGSALGGLVRWLAHIGVAALFGKAWVWAGTAVINVAGCFVLGWLTGWLGAGGAGNDPAAAERAERLRLLLGVGFCGGFTTFSTFGLEMVQLTETRSIHWAAAYAAVSVVLGMTAVRVGLALGRAG